MNVSIFGSQLDVSGTAASSTASIPALNSAIAIINLNGTSAINIYLKHSIS